MTDRPSEASLIAPALALAGLLGAAPLAAIVETSIGSTSLTAPQIAERWSAGVVTVQVRVEGVEAVVQGSGFVVDADGTIATCLHVLDGAAELRVRVDGGRTFRHAVVRAFDVEGDLALLRIDAAELTVLPLGDSDRLEIGDPLVVIGSPLGLERTLSEGLLSARHEPRDEPVQSDLDAAFDAALGRRQLPRTWLLQIGAAISRGSSGAPVFDRRGEVVGIAVGSLVDGASLNFAIPVEALKPLLALEMGLDLASFQERADQARGEMAEPLLDEARFELELGRIEEAERALAQALYLHPRSVDGLLLKAELLGAAGDYEAMEETLVEATRFDADSAEAWYRLGSYHLPPAVESATIVRDAVVIGAAGAPRARDKAMRALRRALEVDEDHVGANRAMGVLLKAEGRYREAASRLERAVAGDPDQLIAGTMLVEVYLAQGEMGKAERAVREVLRRDDDFALAHYEMARVRSARYGELAAHEHWRRFLELSKGDDELEALRQQTVSYLERYAPAALPRD